MMTQTAKWTQTIQISWSNLLAYKANFVFMIIAPAVVFFFIKYNLWSSIYELSATQSIKGYDLDTMLTYQLWILVVSLLSQSHNSMNLATDIRMGRISSYLIYPFQFWQFHTAGFIAFQLLQILIVSLTVGLALNANLIIIHDWNHFIQGFGLSLLVGVLWFKLQYVIGLLSFWLEETWVVRVLVIHTAAFFSGAYFPLDLYPQWITDSLKYTPFPYMSYVPVKIFMGTYEGSVSLAAGILIFWSLVVFLISKWVWHKGLKLYTAAGM